MLLLPLPLFLFFILVFLFLFIFVAADIVVIGFYLVFFLVEYVLKNILPYKRF